jgi:uncharacterized protein
LYVQMALTMLFGLLAGRERWVQRIPELMPRIRRLTWWALAIGPACGAGFTAIFELNREPGASPIKLLGSLCHWTSRPAMMIFYVLVVVRLAQRPAWQRRFAPIAAAGRMPLTSDLMRTLICTSLFDGCGFGLWGRSGPRPLWRSHSRSSSPSRFRGVCGGRAATSRVPSKGPGAG